MRGTVVTTVPGVTRVVAPVKLGYKKGGEARLLDLVPGDELVTLYPMGEAYDRFWYRGEVYSDQIDLPENAFGDPPFSKRLKVISRPVYAWWAEVRLTSGRTGWVIVDGASFDGIDGCE